MPAPNTTAPTPVVAEHFLAALNHRDNRPATKDDIRRLEDSIEELTRALQHQSSILVTGVEAMKAYAQLSKRAPDGNVL